MRSASLIRLWTVTATNDVNSSDLVSMRALSCKPKCVCIPKQTKAFAVSNNLDSSLLSFKVYPLHNPHAYLVRCCPFGRTRGSTGAFRAL